MNAKDFLKAHLGPDVLPLIQWDTLKLSNQSYADKALDFTATWSILVR